jgi:restriction system protein
VVCDEVADLAGVPQEERAVEGSRGTGNPVYRNRIQFARQALIDAGAMIGSSEAGWQRGIWQLSPLGVQLATSQKGEEALTAKLRELATEGARKRADERKESRALAGLDVDSDIEKEPEEDEDDDTSDEQIRDLVEDANDAVLRTMLERVRGMSDTAFEHLVGTVLKASLRAESVTITQRSRDGGIDGVLNFDALGMRLAVFQAKRYGEGNIVGRPAVDAFATAARRRRASHALFVTSSRFSNDAVEAARDEGIRLIEGTAFVELMARHGVGFRARDTFVLYEVDPAWSLEADDTVE